MNGIFMSIIFFENLIENIELIFCSEKNEPAYR